MAELPFCNTCFAQFDLEDTDDTVLSADLPRLRADKDNMQAA